MREVAAYVAICGPDPASPDVLRDAEAVGRALARAGAILVCGGHGGAMEAASKGAHGAGGTIVGILPGRSRADANPYVTVAIPTGMGELRNGLLVRAADAVIAIAGEFGTLSEIALALKAGVPVVGLHTWDLTKRGAPVDPDPIVRVASPEEAVREALRLADDRPR
jgi:uncharacterized protein (TIGR00725 family)